MMNAIKRGSQKINMGVEIGWGTGEDRGPESFLCLLSFHAGLPRHLTTLESMASSAGDGAPCGQACSWMSPAG